MPQDRLDRIEALLEATARQIKDLAQRDEVFDKRMTALAARMEALTARHEALTARHEALSESVEMMAQSWLRRGTPPPPPQPT